MNLDKRCAYGLSRDEAADIAQHSFILLLQNLDGLRDAERLGNKRPFLPPPTPISPPSNWPLLFPASCHL